MGANNGILIRDRLALEEARKLDTVIFDKTGTLTQGKFTVVDQFTKSDWKSEDALSLAASIEGDSEHLIAKAIVDKAQEAGGTLPHTSGFSAIKGRGVKATNQDRPYYVGGPRLLEMLELTLSENFQQFTNSAGDKSQTVVYLTTEKDVISAFAIADGIRPKSKLAIEKLHQSGIQVAMLTGDSQAVADSVARELGIDTVFAEVLPQDKDKKVIEFQQQGKKVAFVGDGVNDAPALTRADIGIAIGGGTDVAIESAGLILVKSNPLDVVTIIHLSRISHRKMVQNLWWVAGYNIIALPLAAGVLAPLGILISPAFGALLMSLSTIIVAINAQLLRNEKLTFETDIA